VSDVVLLELVELVSIAGLVLVFMFMSLLLLIDGLTLVTLVVLDGVVV
jgi:hypothetical protein